MQRKKCRLDSGLDDKWIEALKMWIWMKIKGVKGMRKYEIRTIEKSWGTTIKISDNKEEY